MDEWIWKFFFGLLLVDVEKLFRSVLKIVFDFVMEFLLLILFVVDDEDVIVDEVDESLLRWLVVVESIENEIVDSGFVEGNCFWKKDGLCFVLIRVVCVVLGINELLF